MRGDGGTSQGSGKVFIAMVALKRHGPVNGPSELLPKDVARLGRAIDVWVVL